MFKPKNMHQMNVVIFESKLDEVARAITRLGILHLVKLDEEMPWTRKIKDCDAVDKRREIGRLRDRVSVLMKELAVEEVPLTRGDEYIEEFSDSSLEEIASRLEGLESETEQLIEKRKELTVRLKQLQSIFSRSAPLSHLGIMSPDEKYRFLTVRYGIIRHDNAGYVNEEISSLAAVAITLERRGDEDVILLIGLKKDRLKLKRILREAAFREIKISSDNDVAAGPDVMAGGIRDKIEQIEEEISRIRSKLEEVKEKNASLIAQYYQLLNVGELFIKVKGYMKKTKKTYLFSGWIPSSRKEFVKSEILKAAGGQAIIEIIAPEEIDGAGEGKVNVPVLLKHPNFMRPFGMLVSSYGIPGYRVIDPTFIVAVTFLLMFGMMFGDIGHGAVLCVIGWLTGFRGRKGDAKKKPSILVGKLAFYCGISSIVFGVLFGSVFGLEQLIPGLWRRPMNNVIYFFKVAIFFGVAMISGGILINIVNAIRMNDFKALFFDHAGVVSAAMYWCGIAVVSAFLAGRPIPVRLLVIGIGGPLLLIFLREPIFAALGKRKPRFEEGVFTYMMETVIEIMEIVTGYLGNTVSFIRVAAFSLAHAGLFVAVFSLVDMVKGGSGGIFYSALILILGNAVIIALEGLVVTIQAIRLEYYEFFSKFFVAGGVEYKPIGFEGSSPRSK
ncbi:MAG TPA: V-type ATPase 116kDa subunit family protein [Candidatus Krumholzibacteriaceae bacterium]|nr:V-type ATPase 116kDa subunit family protein [Candidatus Krumholzibacteriaceae bacterium]